MTRIAAAIAATMTLSAVAYADAPTAPGSSPNGAPGPAGNPNQPVGTPQANGPQGPAGNDAQGNSGSAPAAPNSNASPTGQAHSNANSNSHGKSGQPHGKSGLPHGKSHQQHPSSTHGNSATGHANNFGKGKITICHATKSVKNPYVEITISVNGLHGHGPADDSRHHAGSWKDIIPAPSGGCPTTVENNQQQQNQQNEQQNNQQETVTPASAAAAFFALPREEAVLAPQSAVLGARFAGGKKPGKPQTEVLGAAGSAPKAAVAAQHVASKSKGFLPFTGTDLVLVVLAAAAALLGGLALRRALSAKP